MHYTTVEKRNLLGEREVTDSIGGGVLRKPFVLTAEDPHDRIAFVRRNGQTDD